MKSAGRYLLQILFAVVVCLVSALSASLIYFSITDYKPNPYERLHITGKGSPKPVPADSTLVLYTWNIGYCGLGKEMDYFSEDGKMVRPTKQQYKTYREGVVYQLTFLDRPDIILLQEVDSSSKRTYLDNQVERLKASFSNFASSFALNYNVKFVPVPLFHPLGKVTAGQLTLSRWRPLQTERYAIPSSNHWFRSHFMPDGCYVLSRFNVSNGKQLVVINLHNTGKGITANSNTAKYKSLKMLITHEFDKGNYVIACGDWCQNPPHFDTASVSPGYRTYMIDPEILSDFVPQNWQWAYDHNQPTTRKLNKPYQKNITPVTSTDFFLLSPNVELRTVKTIETGFSYSHHQPVGLAVKLR